MEHFAYSPGETHRSHYNFQTLTCALVNLSIILPDIFWLLPDECVSPPVVTPLPGHKLAECRMKKRWCDIFQSNMHQTEKCLKKNHETKSVQEEDDDEG